MPETPICMETDSLLIRGLRDRDLEGLAAMRREPEVYRYEPTFLAELRGTPREAIRAIRKMDLLKDRQCILGIYEKSDPETLAGLAEFYDYKPSGKVLSLGYRLRTARWGRGIGSGCLEAMLRYLRRHTRVELVTAHVIPANRASARILLKHGFEHLVTKPEDWGHDAPTAADVYTLDLPEGENRGLEAE